MLIKLNDKYQIRGIPMNFMLEEKKVSKKKGEDSGKEYWDVVGYYPTLESAVNKLLIRGIQESELSDVNLLIEEIKTSVRSVMAQMEVLSEDGEA